MKQLKKPLILFLLILINFTAIQAIVIRNYYSYFEYAGRMYYGPNKNVKESILMWEADLRTFEDMGYGYAKDFKRVYYQGKQMYDVSPENIKASQWYLITRNSVYCEGKRMKGTDPDSFEIIDNIYDWRYAKDKKYVYKYTERTPYDVSTFRILDNQYFSDTNNIYYGRNGTKVEGASMQDMSFNDEFLISNGAVYLYGYKTKYDAASFDVLTHYKYGCIGRSEDDGFLVSDKDSVYLRGYRIRSFDKESFRLFGKRLFKDKDGVYFYPYYGGRLDKLNLNPRETQGISIKLDLPSNEYNPEYYIVGDKEISYVFEDECGSNLYRYEGIDLDKFEPYLNLNSIIFFRAGYRFYGLGKLTYTSMASFHEMNFFGEDIVLVNFDKKQQYMCLKNDRRILYPEFSSRSNKYSIDAPSFVFIPQSELKLPQLEGIYEDVYMDKNGFYDKEGYFIDKELREGDYEEILIHLISTEEWEQKRKATLENYSITRYPK